MIRGGVSAHLYPIDDNGVVHKASQIIEEVVDPPVQCYCDRDVLIVWEWWADESVDKIIFQRGCSACGRWLRTTRKHLVVVGIEAFGGCA